MEEKKKIKTAKDGVRGMSDANKVYGGEIRQDPDYYVTYWVKGENANRKPYTITFDPAKLPEKQVKYGDRLMGVVITSKR